jgi:hypothetical protein
MKRKRKRAVRVYTIGDVAYWVYGRGELELWSNYGFHSNPKTCEQSCKKQLTRLTGPALAAWLREHPKPKGK